MPTKCSLESASFVSKVPYFEKMGKSLNFSGLNLEQLKDKTVGLKTEIQSGVLWMLKQSKVDNIYGTASFIDAKTIEVDGETISFEKCVIAAGSVVRELDQLSIDSKSVISSSDVFELKTIPKSIAIIGAGPIGCQFATFFNSFGTKVTLIGRSSQILSNEDEDVAKALNNVFKKSNIDVIISAIIEKVDIKDDGVELSLKGIKESISCELILSATGRIPNTKALCLENAGIKVDNRGFIEVSPSFSTTQEHIYVVGDCIDTDAYAYTAYTEAKIAANNIISSKKGVNAHITPSTIFTNPQIASCGLNERDAKIKGLDVRVETSPFEDSSDFVKTVICAYSDVILGVSIISSQATELIDEIAFAVENKLTLSELKEVRYIHPTIAKIISNL